jgi:predicted nuclease of predicted toxin-antitoxin system
LANLAQTRFLLDANLSPKLGRFLGARHGLDIRSLIEDGQAELRDHEVIAVALSEGRVIVTLAQNFESVYLTSAIPLDLGIIYLHPSPKARNNAQIRRMLDEFFLREARTIDLRRSLVVITEESVTIHRPPSKN